MIRRHRTARKRQLRQTDLRRHEHLLRPEARPDGVQRLQPPETAARPAPPALPASGSDKGDGACSRGPVSPHNQRASITCGLWRLKRPCGPPAAMTPSRTMHMSAPDTSARVAFIVTTASALRIRRSDIGCTFRTPFGSRRETGPTVRRAKDTDDTGTIPRRRRTRQVCSRRLGPKCQNPWKDLARLFEKSWSRLQPFSTARASACSSRLEAASIRPPSRAGRPCQSVTIPPAASITAIGACTS